MKNLINGTRLLKSMHTDLCAGIRCKNCTMCTDDGGCAVEEWIDKFPSAEQTEPNSSEKPNNCEPQIYVINPQEPTNDEKCFECDDFFTCGGQCNKIEDEPQTDMAEDIVRSYGFKAESYQQAKAKDEPQTDCDHRCVQTEIGCERTDCAWK